MIEFEVIGGSPGTNTAAMQFAKRAVGFWNFRKRNTVSKEEKARLDKLTLRETPIEEIQRRWQALLMAN